MSCFILSDVLNRPDCDMYPKKFHNKVVLYTWLHPVVLVVSKLCLLGATCTALVSVTLVYCSAVLV